ncbi:glycoside hydrolase family 13 protein [Sulfoacidibacillus thermotolerans]|uniref:Glycosyl hydrolase family 13 catalytic domain-containing protein n=1 Tax=Sulfoacidibacillus thermotolerans TaxID=1765684 RepID=A0A2U3D739_SULT2|nr:glycoside hydrolase family 13 protein [Sulfoacidibacillus thermotolerans]PWI57099.1 hypothetical protein BM613_10080 [Sulfoacidibacillus thermotolerans]
MKSWIYHVPYEPYAYALTETKVRIILCVAPGKAKSVAVRYGDRYEQDLNHQVDMEFDGSDGQWDYYLTEVICEKRRLKYTFQIRLKDVVMWYGESAVSDELKEAGVFQIPYLCTRDIFGIPKWVDQSVAYEIFPDRFAKGGMRSHRNSFVPWSSRPTSDSVYGGDLLGIEDKLQYISDLGIDLLYLTPIFKANSNHKYDTTDYFEIDPQFGTKEDFRRLVNKAHALGIRIVLDAVFNHCGSDFYAFQDVREKGLASRFWSWFFVHEDSVDMEKVNYETFANGVATMPKLHVANPEVEEYLLSVARYWISEFDIDGWRLDVANEIDHVFWRKFRHTVKSIKSDALIIGEVWHDSLPWLRGDQFDGVMNYIFREKVVRFFVTHQDNARTFIREMIRLLHKYPEPAIRSMFNLMGSHDTERILTLAKGNIDVIARVLIFQFSFPGIPMIYYGDEVGMEGAGDPECRGGMVWEDHLQKRELKLLVKRLAYLRHSETALQGTRMIFSEDKRGQFEYKRISKDGLSSVYVKFNFTERRQALPHGAQILLAYPKGCVKANDLLPHGVVIWKDAT